MAPASMGSGFSPKRSLQKALADLEIAIEAILRIFSRRSSVAEERVASWHVRALALCGLFAAAFTGALLAAALTFGPAAVISSLRLTQPVAELSSWIDTERVARPHDPQLASSLVPAFQLVCTPPEVPVPIQSTQSQPAISTEESTASDLQADFSVHPHGTPSAAWQVPTRCPTSVLRAGPLLSQLHVHSMAQEDTDLLVAIRNGKKVREALSLSVTEPRIAFLFFTPGSLPFVHLWERFFQGHDGKYNIYVHSYDDSALKGDYRASDTEGGVPGGCPYPPCDVPGASIDGLFGAKKVKAQKVTLGTMSALDAVRRLLATALADPHNFRFILLSHLCVPLHSFTTMWHYLMSSRNAFVEGDKVPLDPLGRMRGYHPGMAPEVQKENFRRGSMWWAMGRFHAYVVLEDTAIYDKFARYCRYDMWHGYCIPERYYIPTVLQTVAPDRTMNRTVMYEDWAWQRTMDTRVFDTRDLPTVYWRSLQTATHYYLRGKQGDENLVQCKIHEEPSLCYLFLRRVSPSALPLIEAYLKDDGLS